MLPWELNWIADKSTGSQKRPSNESKTWRLANVHLSTRSGREFYAHPVLRVPSVIIPREYNYLLLPAAAQFTAKILWVEPFRFDQRLFSVVEQA
jgi:RES domain-containing protein